MVLPSRKKWWSCIKILGVALATILSFSACDNRSVLDQELAVLIVRHGLTGNPISDPERQVSDISSPKAELGKLLFFSKHLSGSENVACATCHHPFLGGDDDLPLSVGVDAELEDLLGSKRVPSKGVVLVPRNAPTTFNSSLWKKSFFHDGRVERLNSFDEKIAKISTPDEEFGDVDPHATDLLQAQAGFPVTSEHEMRSNYLERSSNDHLRLNLEKRMVSAVKASTLESVGSHSWEALFRNAYNEADSDIEKLVSFARIRELLAEYQRSQIFIDTPWKNYIEGDVSALTDSAKRGAILFYSSVEKGGAGCVSCHSGDFFTDESFHNLAMPQIGFGKELNGNDRGRYLRTGVLEDQYAFRTPSLINVSETAPYTHAGAYFTLEAVVRHHLSPSEKIHSFDFENPAFLQQGILLDTAQLWTERALKKYQQSEKSVDLEVARLNDVDVADLVEFLNHLTDPCVKNESCLKSWVPDPDNNRFPDKSILLSH
ncbi:cytochrome c peroxidase [Alcanivorax sp.]|uniref:cytochrome-c peroxidase n=1 Tax=Alcanivorax sp. TaxID=1872427 RepID=UPI0025C55D2A|nr:cytochrome c peroxidase [Alcanivorax sp.]